MTTTLRATPLTPQLGVRVTGLDLRAPPGPDEAARLRALMREHRLLHFPGQAIDAESHVRLVSLFGPVVGPRRDGPLHGFVAVDADDTVGFHCDYSFTRAPLPYVSLLAVEASGTVAPTAFVDAVAALADLDAGQRARLAGLSVVHASDVTRVGQRSAGALGLGLTRRPAGGVRATTHPAILPHPLTGEPVLFVSESLSVAVEGMERAGSDALLAALFSHLYAPHRIYLHHWAEGDLLVFDNLALQHARMRGPARRLRRVIVSREPLESLLG